MHFNVKSYLVILLIFAATTYSVLLIFDIIFYRSTDRMLIGSYVQLLMLISTNRETWESVPTTLFALLQKDSENRCDLVFSIGSKNHNSICTHKG